MYQGMYDPKHRFHAMSRMASHPVLTYQKGLREKLLCRDCEQQFGRYETYAAQFFYGSPQLAFRKEGKHFTVGGADYKRLKLFFLSLLWRFGVTSVDILSGTDLGPHAEVLRKMLLAEDPGGCLVYPCLVTAVTWKGTHIADLIVGPSTAKMEGHRIWQFVVAGFVFTFFVSSHLPPAGISSAFLQSNGSLIIGVREIEEIDFLYRNACEIANAQKVRKK